MGRKERAKERREKRLEDIAEQRKIPYTDQQRWWCSETIAVVTGANRGIGYEIARQLAVHGLNVIITSRDIDNGRTAAKALQEEGLNVSVHQLDILDPDSVKMFAEWICESYGGIDILVNNAGVNFNLGSDNSVEYAEKVIATNYFGTKRMIETMIPLMKASTSGARIVNVSSRLGRLNGRRNRLGDVALRQELTDEGTLSEELIDRTMANFLEEVKLGSWTSGLWPQMYTDYSVSKLAVNAYTRLMAKALSNRSEGQQIYINCYCPGWVKTAMTGWAGNSPVEEGADTGVWLALFPGQPVSGKFFAERREINY
ncbi:Short-chain dehydrogenase/reductase SDR [Macleaya cordata]|uniref:Short-chain dehydrogenase/reductase n=1 Tax=Macleaya cordata TaxID=56857 RepID=A0A200R3Q1_MACCD|nr:Short-chain dehydrogenase/reductase SDR [Macleaya cordata]